MSPAMRAVATEERPEFSPYIAPETHLREFSVRAVILGLGYLAYDLAIRHGATLPGGDLRTLYLVIDVAIVLVAGAVVTWLVVPQPRGSGATTTRSGWSAALGFFAAVPVCYLVLVVIVQVLEPLIG